MPSIFLTILEQFKELATRETSSNNLHLVPIILFVLPQSDLNYIILLFLHFLIPNRDSKSIEAGFFTSSERGALYLQ